MTIVHLIMVGLGGFFGAIARFLISKQLNAKAAIPLGTLTVNLAGAFLLGMISGAKADPTLALLFGTGFMGAFTTFSTLKLEMLQFLLKKQKWQFYLYTFLTYIIGIFLAYLGYLLGSQFR